MIEDVDLGDGEVTVNFDGSTVAFLFGELNTVVPAYAATIHKSKGSEYPAVMTQHYAMLQRNLVYSVSATAWPYAARLDGWLKRHGMRSSMPLCGWPSRMARRVAAM